jgi:hypothetical protein
LVLKKTRPVVCTRSELGMAKSAVDAAHGTDIVSASIVTAKSFFI